MRSLIIVARDRVDLWKQLTRQFAKREVEVILDRRQQERRQGILPWRPGIQRGAERRRPATVQTDVLSRQYVITRPKQSEMPAPASPGIRGNNNHG